MNFVTMAALMWLPLLVGMAAGYLVPALIARILVIRSRGD